MAQQVQQKALMTAANGMEVWVPEEKLEAWEAAQRDKSPEARARRQKLAQQIKDRLSSLKR